MTSVSDRLILILTAFSSFAGESSSKDTIIQDIVIGVTVVVTFVAMWYIYHLMSKVKPQVIYERRKARYASLRTASNALVINGKYQASEA